MSWERSYLITHQQFNYDHRTKTTTTMKTRFNSFHSHRWRERPFLFMKVASLSAYHLRFSFHFTLLLLQKKFWRNTLLVCKNILADQWSTLSNAIDRLPYIFRWENFILSFKLYVHRYVRIQIYKLYAYVLGRICFHFTHSGSETDEWWMAEVSKLKNNNGE